MYLVNLNKEPPTPTYTFFTQTQTENLSYLFLFMDQLWRPNLDSLFSIFLPVRVYQKNSSITKKKMLKKATRLDWFRMQPWFLQYVYLYPLRIFFTFANVCNYGDVCKREPRASKRDLNLYTKCAYNGLPIRIKNILPLTTTTNVKKKYTFDFFCGHVCTILYMSCVRYAQYNTHVPVSWQNFELLFFCWARLE